MDAKRRFRGVVAIATGAVLALAACGGEGQVHPGNAAPSPASAGAFDEVLAAVQPARVPWCAGPAGEAYIPLPAPPAESAAAASYFRYLEGRIYQFGPCGVAAEDRNELRIFRYPDAVARDAAIRDISARYLRPTASFAVGDTLDAEIWSPNPSLEGPVGRAAAAVHGALGQMTGSRHLDVGP